MRKLLFTLMLLASSLALAATVYRWVDDNGVVHYSDQPHPNAEKLTVHAAQTYKASVGPQLGNAPPQPGNGAGPPTLPQRTAYNGCAIVQPADAQDFANLDSLPITVMTDPQLHGGDQVFISLDGQPLNNGAATGPQFTLAPVDRGQHSLQATVRDPQGNVLCQSPSVTFNVHQPSTANPVNPVRPH
jgi:Domain of unknown function (DUF4124)